MRTSFLILPLLLSLPARAQVWEAMASATQMFTAACPQDSSGNNLPGVADAETEATFAGECPDCGASGKAGTIKGFSNDIADAAYLGALAKERAANHECAINQLVKATGPEFDAYLADITRKLEGISELKRERQRMARDMRSVPLGERNAKADEMMIKMNEMDAAIVAKQAAIPFNSHPRMAKLINETLEENTRLIRPLRSDSKLESEPLPEKFQGELLKALTDVREHLRKDADNLEEGARTQGTALDRATRESLAQDDDLIQGYVERNPKIRETLRGTACRVDRVYGSGAASRDTALTYGSIGLFAIGGVAGLGAKGIASFGNGALAGVRIASARGLLTPNAARVLGVMAVQTGRASLALGTAAGLKEAATECLNKHQITAHAGTVKDRCENYSLKGISADNCYLTAGLTILGAVTNLPSTQKFLGRLSGAFTRAEEVTGRPLSAAEKAAVQKAHEVGAGTINPKNGKPAGYGNYTEEQLREKAEILKAAGFNETERRRLIESGVVGMPAPPHDFRPMNTRFEFGGFRKHVGGQRTGLNDKGDELITFKHRSDELKKNGIENLSIDQNGYTHIRKHFLTAKDGELLAKARDDRATIQYLREMQSKGKHTVIFGHEPEMSMAAGLRQGLADNKVVRLAGSDRGRGTYELTAGKTKLRLTVCESEVCDEFGKRGQIITFYPVCGPSVYQIAAEQALSTFRERPGAVTSALVNVPCK